MRLELSERLNEIRAGTGVAPRDQAAGDIDIRVIPDFFRRRWKIVLAVTLMTFALFATYVFTATPRYSAFAQVLLEPKSDKTIDQLLGKKPDAAAELDSSVIDTQIELMQTLRVMRRVVEREKLLDDPEIGVSAGPQGIRALYGRAVHALLRLFQKPEDAGTADDDPVLTVAENLQGMVDVQRSGKAYVVLLSVTSVDPEKAARLANAVADAYIQDRMESRYEAARNDSKWLTDRLDSLRGELKASEDAVATFRSEHNLITPKQSGSTVNDQQLVDLNGRLVAAQTDTAEKLVKLQQAERVASAKGRADAIPDVLRSPVIMDLRRQDAELGRKEADLVARYGAQYPLVVNVRAERGNLQRSIQAETARIVTTLRNDYEVAKAGEDQLRESLRQLTGRSGADETVAVRLRELERAADANKALYEDFLQRAKLTQEQTELHTREARIVNEATVNYTPVAPKKGLLLGLGIFMGLFFGVCGAAASDLLNAGFTGPAQIEDALDLPVLSSIFKVRRPKGEKGESRSPAFLVAERPLSRYAEGIRGIWTALRTTPGDQPPHVLAVTSSFPREAKSTTALSLALSAIELGGRVLIIDADLRRPSLAKTLDMVAEPGLSDVLAGRAAIREAIHHNRSLGISVLPAGKATTSPLGLLSSERMRALVEGLRGYYDVVIIDTPPLGPVTDAVMISQLVDKLIFVTAWSTTPREAVSTALRKLPNPRKIAGVVLTMVDDRKVSYAGKYGYYGLPQFEQYYSN